MCNICEQVVHAISSDSENQVFMKTMCIKCKGYNRCNVDIDFLSLQRYSCNSTSMLLPFFPTTTAMQKHRNFCVKPTKTRCSQIFNRILGTNKTGAYLASATIANWIQLKHFLASIELYSAEKTSEGKKTPKLPASGDILYLAISFDRLAEVYAIEFREESRKLARIHQKQLFKTNEIVVLTVTLLLDNNNNMHRLNKFIDVDCDKKMKIFSSWLFFRQQNFHSFHGNGMLSIIFTMYYYKTCKREMKIHKAFHWNTGFP